MVKYRRGKKWMKNIKPTSALIIINCYRESMIKNKIMSRVSHFSEKGLDRKGRSKEEIDNILKRMRQPNYQLGIIEAKNRENLRKENKKH